MAINTNTVSASEAVRPASGEVPAEILAAIAAAAIALLGANIHIRSAELLPNHESVSRWARQGRASVQASHNLRPKR